MLLLQRLHALLVVLFVKHLAFLHPFGPSAQRSLPFLAPFPTSTSATAIAAQHGAIRTLNLPLTVVPLSVEGDFVAFAQALCTITILDVNKNII